MSYPELPEPVFFTFPTSGKFRLWLILRLLLLLLTLTLTLPLPLVIVIVIVIVGHTSASSANI